MNVKAMISAPRTLLILRVSLGIAFILASYSKIMNPAHLKALIAEYQILPEEILAFTAVALPWIQLLSGILLLANIYSQSSALVMLSLLFIFTVGMTNNYLRGLIHDCGCFEFLGSWFGIKEEISLVQITRDIALMVLTLPVLVYGSNRGPGRKHRF